MKDKQKRKKRIQFITSKIKEMQKKRTFLTAPDMVVVESDEDEAPAENPLVDVFASQPADIFDEYT